MKSFAAKQKALEQKDKKYVWHPFTQMQEWAKEELVIIDHAKGNYLIDLDGKKYLDGVSSLWCNVHGHQVPEIDRAIKEQLRKVAHSTFLGLTHEPAIVLAEMLVRLAPPGLSRVFYSDSGSEAVEIALKIAFQYWQQKNETQKQKFVRLENAYHGDTLGAVSVGGIDLFHQVYGPMLFPSYRVPSPYAYRWPGADDLVEAGRKSLNLLEQTLRKHHQEIAAIVMEPLMQGAAGMIHQPEGYLSAVRKIASKYNVLLIFDEVATGFGRTGKMFASDHEKVAPDLLACAKGLTGGYLPLAATLATEKVYEAFLGRYEDFKTFFHGHTFTANPLACQAAIASLKLFKTRRILPNVCARAAQMQRTFKEFQRLRLVGDIRQVGLMAGIELVKDKQTKALFDPSLQIGVRVIKKARKKGIILRPLGPVIVLMPPLSINKKEMDFLMKVTYESIDEVARELL